MEERHSILIIEDEEIIRSSIKLMLKDLPNATIYEASHLAQASEFLKAYEIDVILLDIYLEDKTTGIEYIDAIMNESEHSQIIMISSDRTMDIIITSIKKGAFYYLNKPIDKDDLLLLVDKALKICRMSYS